MVTAYMRHIVAHNPNLVAVVGWSSRQRNIATNETPPAPPLPAGNLASPIRESSLSGLTL
jgi:hypothetical protein